MTRPLECEGGGTAPVLSGEYWWDNGFLVGDPYGVCAVCGQRVAIVNHREVFYAIRHFAPETL